MFFVYDYESEFAEREEDGGAGAENYAWRGVASQGIGDTIALGQGSARVKDHQAAAEGFRYALLQLL